MTDRYGEVVLAGIDDTSESWLAVDWAAAETQRRGAALRLVHALGTAVEIGYDETGTGLTEQVFEAATKLLGDAQTRVATAYPGLRTDTALVHDHPAEALLDSAKGADADMIVLGTRGRGGFAGLLLGSVSLKVAAHAEQPTVIVREQMETAADGVVVGIRDDRDGPAVRFALAEAATRRTTVRMVHAWEPVSRAGLMVPQLDRVDEDQRHHTDLLDRAARPAANYPHVRVETELVMDSPAAALVEASKQAGLVVLPRHPVEGRLGLPLGSVAHAVLHHASCPVAIVPVP
ncbi:universal stress protein [Streptomyces coelicoflavus]|uniref:universal stress protein n=1 Tax=Streptomyces coelicoflavus TaxID=285562 RepID=UPI0036AACA67